MGGDDHDFVARILAPALFVRPGTPNLAYNLWHVGLISLRRQ